MSTHVLPARRSVGPLLHTGRNVTPYALPGPIERPGPELDTVAMEHGLDHLLSVLEERRQAAGEHRRHTCGAPSDTAVPPRTHKRRPVTTGAVLGFLESPAVPPDVAVLVTGLGPTWSVDTQGKGRCHALHFTASNSVCKQPSEEKCACNQVVNVGTDDGLRSELDRLKIVVNHRRLRIGHKSPAGKYMYDLDEARQACAEQDATLASYHQLHTAWMDGLQKCACGWLSDGTRQYPMQTDRGQGCGGRAGIITCEHNSSNAWCYRGLSVCD
ncbi:HAPLN3 [Branchiostoma lanceolatum]|uniref:HAPLN3 protein n=1 Tax=Branchiostoma lanceolatum TaxID=7740 RepID=A0A8K0AHL5_BRALA|nr:HAPLN3 [Branchiostoma lanceolatum]